MPLSLKKVCRKDDCDTTKRKDSYDTRRSKQNTYHVVNKNIAPSTVTDGLKTKEGMPSRISPSLGFLVSLNLAWYALGIPKLELFPLLISSSMRTSPKTWKLHNTKLKQKLVITLVQENKLPLLLVLQQTWILTILMMVYCILTFPWLVPPDTNHSFIKTSNQLNKNRICQKQTSL